MFSREWTELFAEHTFWMTLLGRRFEVRPVAAFTNGRIHVQELEPRDPQRPTEFVRHNVSAVDLQPWVQL